MQFSYSKTSGFSLVEAIFVSALVTIMFGAIFSSFQYSLRLVGNSRAKLSAMSIATERMEYFRSLPYANVGTVSGIPSGTIPQHSTTTLNGIEFVERVLVEYVDDSADGLDVLDSNGIVSDYKRIKLEYSWTFAGETNSIASVSNIVPKSVESTTGGGSVRINVIDDSSNLLQGASVRLINNTTGTPIDVTKITDVNGSALFSGAPAGSEYEVIVNGNIAGKEYSTDQTYQITVANPTPVVAPFSLLEADISTLTFQIGILSNLVISTFSDMNEGMLREKFSNATGFDSSTDVDTDDGKMKLKSNAGVYFSTGSVYLGPITPVPLQSWQTVRTAITVPVDTSIYVQFFTGVAGGPYVIIPDVDLLGNAAGFTSTNIDISDLDPAVYPTIFVRVTLDTADTSKTPKIDELSVFYQQSETVLPNITFDLVSSKIIGADALGVSLPKYSNTHTTDALGVLSLTNVEFGDYLITPAGSYDIASACSSHPLIQQAGIDNDYKLVLVANALNTLRVSVVDNLGDVIPGATVKLQRSGYDVTKLTNNCGQAFFTGGVTDNGDYNLTISTTGYITDSTSNFLISGDIVDNVILMQ
jgi:type II secretory pathway pseudopilin PulG